MIKVSQLDNGVFIILEPDRSSDWRGNQIVIAILGSVCFAIALGFYFVLGIWMILPFAGLEVVALAAGLYYASWKLHYQQHLTIDADTLKIEKGVYRPKGVWQWQKQQVYLKIVPAKHDWSAAELSLHHHNQNHSETIEIGSFLGKDDTLELIDVLSNYLQIRREA